MHISGKYSVEQIENGFIVRDLGNKRAVHVTYRWDIARQIERFMHDQVTEHLADEQAIAEAGALDRDTVVIGTKLAALDVDPVTFREAWQAAAAPLSSFHPMQNED